MNLILTLIMKKLSEFEELVRVMHQLRKDCPWDQEQSLESLRSYLIEEAYECLDAMNHYTLDRPEHLVEELGDVLLQVVFQAEILSEQHKKDMSREIISKLIEKLKRRHPHIFGDTIAESKEEVLKNWEKIKAEEKGNQQAHSALTADESSMTALQLASKLGKQSKKSQFDWDELESVWKQTESEIEELKSADSQLSKEQELGDVLFCICQLARHLKVDPEVALSGSNQRFIRRFRLMEEMSRDQNREFEELSSAEKEEMWKKAKAKLQTQNP